MTAPTAASAAATRPTTSIDAPFIAVVKVGVRQLLAGKLWIAYLVAPSVIGMLFGALLRLGNDPGGERFAITADIGLFGLAVPITCLMVGDRSVGADVRDGSFVLTWLSPVRLSTIAVGRWLAGFVVSSAVLSLAMALSALAAGSIADVLPSILAVTATCSAYIAVFVFLGLWAKRAAIWSLAFVFVFERLLGGPLSAIGQLSPQWLGRGVLAAFGTDAESLERDGVPEGVEALIRLAIITAVFLLLSVWRLRSVRLSGSRD